MADRGNITRTGREQDAVHGRRSQDPEQPTGSLGRRLVLWISIQAIFVVLALLITAALQSTTAG